MRLEPGTLVYVKDFAYRQLYVVSQWDDTTAEVMDADGWKFPITVDQLRRYSDDVAALTAQREELLNLMARARQYYTGLLARLET